MDLSTICQQIILASSSKSRIEYLRREKIDFKVRPHKIDESIIKKKVDLIIALDCGTTSFEAIDLALKKKVDVIIIDHHKSQEILPKANALINPNRFDESGDYYYLCAAGLLFIFLVVLRKQHYTCVEVPVQGGRSYLSMRCARPKRATKS